MPEIAPSKQNTRIGSHPYVDKKNLTLVVFGNVDRRQEFQCVYRITNMEAPAGTFTGVEKEITPSVQVYAISTGFSPEST